MNTATSRTIVGVTAIIALATIVGLAIFHRDSGFEMTLGDGDRKVSLDFKDNTVDVGHVLDTMLAETEANASNKELIEALLANRGYYHVTDVRLVSALTELTTDEENSELNGALRSLLYELKGPFAEPNPFAGVRNTLLVDAIMELDPRKTLKDDGEATIDSKSGNGASRPINPLMSELWRRSIEIEGIFRPPEIRATIRQGRGIRPGTAVACSDSLLARKQITITTSGVQKRVMVDAREFCGQAAPNAQQLLAGEREELYLAPDDFVEIAGVVPAAANGTARRDPVEVSVVVAPKHFVSLPPGAAPH